MSSKSGNPAKRAEAARAAAAQEPPKDPKVRIQFVTVVVLYAIAVAGFGLAIYFMTTDHPESGIAGLLVPIAAIIVARMVPRGWRGGPSGGKKR